MIINGRSPHMRPSCFTNALCKPGLVKVSILDPNILVNYVHILTTGSFAHDMWCDPMILFGIVA